MHNFKSKADVQSTPTATRTVDTARQSTGGSEHDINLKKMHSLIIQCSIIAKTLSFHQKHTNLAIDSAISFDILTRNLDELEKLANTTVNSRYGSHDNTETPDSFISRSDDANLESKEGTLAE